MAPPTPDATALHPASAIQLAPAPVLHQVANPASEELEKGYQLSHRLYEVAGMSATVLTGAWLAARVFGDEHLRLWWLPVALALGMMGADLVSGCVHWLFDTWGSVDTPVVGKLAIRTFRQHHIDPKAMLHHDFVETNGHNFALALTLTGGGLWVLYARDPSDRTLFAATFMLMMAVFVSLTSQIHKWAHMPTPPAAIVPLQRLGVLLSPEHHQEHHNAPHSSNYCITVGWMDGALTRSRFFPRVERVIAWCTGVEPRRHG